MRFGKSPDAVVRAQEPAYPFRIEWVAPSGGSNKNYRWERMGCLGPVSAKEYRKLVNLHMIIGLATLAAFLLLTIVNGLRAFRGSEISWARGLSFAAAGLLLIQYVIGFALLGSDHKMKAIHYIIALVAIVPVGAEHMMAAQEPDPRRARMIAFVANVIALVLIIVAYSIGDRNGA